ncbi:MAG: hypothetical protein SchgKO_05720 [Schleiferiaceae bacterium]
MRGTILKYGFIGGAVLILFSSLGWFLGDQMSFAMREVISYASIIMSSFVVFFGIKHQRDHFGNGKISFAKAIRTGLAIMIIPALLYGFFNMVYVIFIDPNYAESYFTTVVQEAETSMTSQEYAKFKAYMEENKALFSGGFGIFFTFLVMTLGVYALGILTTLFSALMLKKN